MDHVINNANDSKVAVGGQDGARPSEGRRVSWANTADVKTVNYVRETRKQRLYRILAQVVATSVKNLMLLDLGMIIGFPTILIPAVHHAGAAGLTLDDDEASWIGSISMICQPVGSLLSGVLLEGVGRKRAMMLINAPLLLGWMLFYWATSPAMLYAASCVLGLCVGFMEAPTLTYIAEICEPRLRGVLTSYSETCVSAGIFLQYLLGSATSWRTTALVSAALPLVTALALTQIPETPMWLLSRGRTSEAEASLRWLRGWTSPGAVQEELRSLSAYAEMCAALDKTPPPRPRRRRPSTGGGDVMSPEEELAAALATLHERHRGSQHFTPVGLGAGAAQGEEAGGGGGSSDEEECCELPLCRRSAAVLQRATLRPLLVVSVFFLLQHWTGITGLRPYLVEVSRSLGLPGDAHWNAVVMGLATLLGFLTCVLAVKRLGKKRLSLLSFGVTAASLLLLGAYVTAGAAVGSWAPLTLLVLVFLASSVGIAPIPWILLSEVFPFRTRGLASGLGAAVSYVVAFSASKTFYDLEGAVGLAGLFFLYGAVGLVGLVFVHFFLVETEGRSLEDIEKDYGGGFQLPPPVQRRSVIKKSLAEHVVEEEEAEETPQEDHVTSPAARSDVTTTGDDAATKNVNNNDVQVNCVTKI